MVGQWKCACVLDVATFTWQRAKPACPWGELCWEPRAWQRQEDGCMKSLLVLHHLTPILSKGALQCSERSLKGPFLAETFRGGGFPETRSDKIVSGGFRRKSGLELQISGLPISGLGWLWCFLIIFFSLPKMSSNFSPLSLNSLGWFVIFKGWGWLFAPELWQLHRLLQNHCSLSRGSSSVSDRAPSFQML